MLDGGFWAIETADRPVMMIDKAIAFAETIFTIPLYGKAAYELVVELVYAGEL